MAETAVIRRRSRKFASVMVPSCTKMREIAIKNATLEQLHLILRFGGRFHHDSLTLARPWTRAARMSVPLCLSARRQGPRPSWVLPAISATVAAVFTLDWITPLGYAVWIAYLVPVGLCLYTGSARARSWWR